MVAIKAQQAGQFLKSPPKTLASALFFGTDPGLVSERAALLGKLLAERSDPPGETMRLDDSDLEDDSGRLAVELNTRPMFAGRRIIRASAGRRITAALLKPILAAAPFDGVLLVEAGNLKPDDALRALYEKAGPDCVAIGCYPDAAADLDGLITEVLTGFQMRIDLEARTALMSRLGADRAFSRAEIEKLALYAMGRPSISVDDVEAIVGDAADLALERIAEAAARGDTRTAITDFGRAIASGESAQAIILITQRFFLKLHKVRSDVDGGQTVEEALRALRPPLHFKQRDQFAAMVRTWSRPALEAALKRIAETASAARRSSALEETLGERLVLAIAAMKGANTRPGAAASR